MGIAKDKSRLQLDTCVGLILSLQKLFHSDTYLNGHYRWRICWIPNLEPPEEVQQHCQCSSWSALEIQPWRCITCHTEDTLNFASMLFFRVSNLSLLLAQSTSEHPSSASLQAVASPVVTVLIISWLELIDAKKQTSCSEIMGTKGCKHDPSTQSVAVDVRFVATDARQIFNWHECPPEYLWSSPIPVSPTYPRRGSCKQIIASLWCGETILSGQGW